MIVKEYHLLEKASAYFENTNVTITTDGKSHLGAALGTEAFVYEFVNGKVQQWVEEVKHLSLIAQTQPHAAYSAFSHGLSSKWAYLCRIVPNIEELIQPLEDAICHHFIPALTGKSPPNDMERNLFSLLCRLGGIGITNPSKSASSE